MVDTTPAPRDHSIGLAAAIAQLRKELGDAQDAGAGQQLRFTVTEAEVELLVELHQEQAGEAKITVFNVLTAGASAKLGTGATHRLKLKLTVNDQATGGQAAEITGTRRPPASLEPRKQ